MSAASWSSISLAAERSSARSRGRGAGSRPSPEGATGRRHAGCARSCGARSLRSRRSWPWTRAAPPPACAGRRVWSAAWCRAWRCAARGRLTRQLSKQPVVFDRGGAGGRRAPGGDQAEQPAARGNTCAGGLRACRGRLSAVLGRLADARQILLAHHKPDRTDAELDLLAARLGWPPGVAVAIEGRSLGL